MDTGRRTWAKAVLWQLLGLVSMALVGLLVTGSLVAGGTMAALNTFIGLIVYVFYERIWNRISWGRRPDEGSWGDV